MKWSAEAWSEITPIFDKILSLPFIKELTAGTLPKNKFIFYMEQDSIYLSSYVQVLSHIASRMPWEDFRSQLLEFAVDGINVEKAIHHTFLAGESKDDTMATPTTLLYTSLLKAQAYSPIEVEMASVLPCFWVYQRIGETILANAHLESNTYRKWIETYADRRFALSTQAAIDICDKLASEATPEIRREMTHIFIIATKMEMLFWQSAYNLEEWKI
ncbi:MAG: TenA family protein [Muribaculaceae bacterium]|nr:TenA family protein [Muribaculaceae bacterium]